MTEVSGTGIPRRGFGPLRKGRDADDRGEVPDRASREDGGRMIEARCRIGPRVKTGTEDRGERRGDPGAGGFGTLREDGARMTEVSGAGIPGLADLGLCVRAGADDRGEMPDGLLREGWGVDGRGEMSVWGLCVRVGRR